MREGLGLGLGPGLGPGSGTGSGTGKVIAESAAPLANQSTGQRINPSEPTVWDAGPYLEAGATPVLPCPHAPCNRLSLPERPRNIRRQGRGQALGSGSHSCP